ncbi:hypothetical protein [Streptomyces longisporoflavus]|uniref:Uncharacterized protein n=1 Tax=Streptomyces longisporoflavus TaxID=28044 RepID=A0ABW7QJ41_9ACTN
MRLIPDDPFPEIGAPLTTDVSADGRWIAVSCHAGGRNGMGRVVIYRASDLALWDQIVLERGVEHLAFHPVVPVLAVGTEDGDEFALQGGLHLYEPETRRRTDVAVAGAGVPALRWRDARRLDVTFAEPVIDFDDPGRVTWTRAVAEHDDWHGVTADVLAAQISWPRVPVKIDGSSFRGQRIEEPERYLADLAAQRGRVWARRPGTSVLEVLSDGRMLVSVLTGALLECWSPHGTLLWSVPAPDDAFERSGCRLYVTPDEESVWLPVLKGDSGDRRTLLRRFALADVRAELLEKWVVRAGPEGIERLFPFAWDDSLGPYLRGGPAVYVDDEAGPGIIHTCTAHDATHLVRRAYPGGAVIWAHRFEARVTGVDVHEGLVHAVTGAGSCELLTLRAAEGTVVRRGTLTLGGHVYIPTCLSAGPDGELVIGTVEGRLITTRHGAGRSAVSAGAYAPS